MKRLTITFASLLCAATLSAQNGDGGSQKSKWNPLDSLTYNVVLQSSFSNGKTPLWLNANKYGMSSLERNNGYARASVYRPLSADDEHKFGLAYGVDVAVPYNYTSNFVLQQAYVEGRWLKGTLTIGAKEEPMELKNSYLSSGSQTLGINARPTPGVRLALPDYWTVPLTRGWLHFKGHMFFGVQTDGDWQEDFAKRYHQRFTKNVITHTKAGYLMIGNPEKFIPWSVELGLEMVTYFGGDIYRPTSDGGYSVDKRDHGFKDYFKSFWGFGAEKGETEWTGKEGDMLGSWVARINYDGDINSFHFYADKFFEDHSMMFQVDKTGYGSGEEWTKWKKKKFIVYDMKDMMLGFEWNYKPDSWLNDFVFEYLYTKYQSGPIYHDHTPELPDHLGGSDNYYNHYMYSGHQHWGQVAGNPLYRSPIYNDTYDKDGTMRVRDNRFIAFHMGLGGHPNEYLRYRLLATWQEGWGTYETPYTKTRHNFSMLAEASYALHSIKHSFWNGVNVTVGAGADFGSILEGNNYGVQFTISKTGLIKF